MAKEPEGRLERRQILICMSKPHLGFRYPAFLSAKLHESGWTIQGVSDRESGMKRGEDNETGRQRDPAKAVPDEAQEPWPVRPVRTWSGEIRHQPETQKTLQEWIRRARNDR